MVIVTKDDLMETDPDPDPVEKEKEDTNHQNNGPAPTPANTKTTDPPPANKSGGKIEADVTSPVIDVDGDDATKVCAQYCIVFSLNSLFRTLNSPPPPEVSQTTTLPSMKTIGG